MTEIVESLITQNFVDNPAYAAVALIPYRGKPTFVKDGKVYRIPKAYQSVQAKRSGLSYPSGETDVPIQPRCKTCKRRYSCNGCHWCGKCGGK